MSFYDWFKEKYGVEFNIKHNMAFHLTKDYKLIKEKYMKEYELNKNKKPTKKK